MRFFVASWFFPPSTSSEGIVSYKLFRNSAHTYDVCSSKSTLWSYDQVLEMNASNIEVFAIETNELEEWVDKACALFEERHAKNPYDALMTRSMPPESIEVARRIREKHPDIAWIASLGDPIAKSPYDIKAWVIESSELKEQEKRDFQVALSAGCDAWKDHGLKGIRKMCALKEVEDYAINNATALIFPHDTPKNYVLGVRPRKYAFSVPHTFDKSLYPQSEGTGAAAGAASAGADAAGATAAGAGETVGAGNTSQSPNTKTTFAFLGHSDGVRSLEPVVRALNHLRTNDEAALENIQVRFIGNVPEHIRSLIYNYYLFDYISIEDSVSYITSLAIMQNTDWLIHIDAAFDFLKDTGGSIYFAGKLADYMGTNTPILAVTGKHTPAYEIVRRAGGINVEQDDIAGLAQTFADIARKELKVSANRQYRDTFDAVYVAKEYDLMMERAVGATQGVADSAGTQDATETQNTLSHTFNRAEWPEVADSRSTEEASKFLSICVPAYNVECYLDRCLLSLMQCKQASKLDIIVVNDGSPDSSREIALAYQEHYPHIVRLIDKENGGHGSTINAALECACGTYFRVIDGDDWVDSRNLDTLISNIESKNLYADLVSSNYHQVYGEDGHTVPWMKAGSEANYALFNLADEDFREEYFTMASTMVKTEILKQANFKLQEHTYYVDVEFILFPIPYVKTVMFTPEYIYRYAVGNADQSINPDNFVRKYDHHDRVIRRMVSYYANKQPSMGTGQIEYMKSLFVRHLLKSHYTLSLAWDTDRARGCKRASDFDTFLAQTAPDLYEAMQSAYPSLKMAAKLEFDPEKIGEVHSIDDPISTPARQKIRETARSLEKSPVGNAIVHNPVSRALMHRLPR